MSYIITVKLIGLSVLHFFQILLNLFSSKIPCKIPTILSQDILALSMVIGMLYICRSIHSSVSPFTCTSRMQQAVIYIPSSLQICANLAVCHMGDWGEQQTKWRTVTNTKYGKKFSQDCRTLLKHLKNAKTFFELDTVVVDRLH